MTHSGHERQSFTSCSSRPSLGRFLYLLLHSDPRGHPDASQPPAPGRPGSQHFRGTKARRGGTSAWPPQPGPRNRPHPVSHAGFLDLRPTGPRPSSSVTPAARPTDTQARTPRQATVNITHRDTVRTTHPGHAPSFSAPRRPARSLGFRLSCRCFVSDEYSRPTEQVVLGPALEVSRVAISGLGDVGPWTREGTELPAARIGREG